MNVTLTRVVIADRLAQGAAWTRNAVLQVVKNVICRNFSLFNLEHFSFITQKKTHPDYYRNQIFVNMATKDETAEECEQHLLNILHVSFLLMLKT